VKGRKLVSSASSGANVKATPASQRPVARTSNHHHHTSTGHASRRNEAAAKRRRRLEIHRCRWWAAGITGASSTDMATRSVMCDDALPTSPDRHDQD
jgi:hypothetical protein